MPICYRVSVSSMLHSRMRALLFVCLCFIFLTQLLNMNTVISTHLVFQMIRYILYSYSQYGTVALYLRSKHTHMYTSRIVSVYVSAWLYFEGWRIQCCSLATTIATAAKPLKLDIRLCGKPKANETSNVPTENYATKICATERERTL